MNKMRKQLDPLDNPVKKPNDIGNLIARTPAPRVRTIRNDPTNKSNVGSGFHEGQTASQRQNGKT